LHIYLAVASTALKKSDEKMRQNLPELASGVADYDDANAANNVR